MKKRALSFFMILILLMSTSSFFGQNIFFNRVAPPEGKIFVHITGMVQDRQGYMWFASKKGLFRYDGYEMSHFKNNPTDSSSLATDALEAIAIDSAGIIWLATFGGFGLDRFDPAANVFTHFRHNAKDPTSLGSDHLAALLVDHKGLLWVGTDAGLDRFDAPAGKFIHYRYRPNDPTSISSNQVRALYEDRQGTLWVGTGSPYINDGTGPGVGGLNRLDKMTGKFTRYLHDPKDPKSLINNKVRAIFEDSKGTFWIGTAGDGLHTMDRARGTFTRHHYDPAHPEKLSRPAFKKGLGYDHITFITEDVGGGLWIGTVGSGLNYFDPKTQKATHFELEKNAAGAFTDREVWSAYTSRDGVLWISTINGNLYRVNPLRRGITYQMAEEGCVTSFFEEEDGTLWTATTEGLVIQRGLGKGDVKRYIHNPADSGSLSNNFVVALKQDRQGRMWVGTEGGLDLWDRKKGHFTHYRHNSKDSHSLSSDFIISIYEDQNANLWIGTSRGLNLMNPKSVQFTRYIFHPEDTATQGLGLNIVTSILQERQKKMWVGCAMVGDVHLLNQTDGTFKTFLKGMGIQSFCKDADGTLWAGGDEGLFWFNRAKGDFEPYMDPGTRSGLSFVHSIVEDTQKNLWLGTESGILKLNRHMGIVRRYGKAYGVYGNTLCPRSIYKGNQGQLFFGCYAGYFAFFPQQLSQTVPPPQIVFSNFRLAGRPGQQERSRPEKKPLSQLQTIRLRHNQNAFAFDFAAIDFTEPESNRHYFMLEHYDEDWHQTGSDRRAIYYNVPPGAYVFRVKAANSNGIWAEKIMNITIVPPWWSTWWFRIPAAILVVTFLYGIIRWRMQQKFHLQLERSEKEKQLAELQQQKAELEMQALRAQMNPHFIFNSLNSINRFILQNNKAQATEYLTKFSRLVRLILQNSQAPLVTLESELEALQLYLELEALRFEQHFDFQVRVDENIDEAVLKVPPLIIQPFAENAIWHGLMHKPEKGHLGIKLFQEDGVLCCKITDDGVGRKKAAELKKGLGNTHRSMGMRITADRIALLQQQKLTHTSVQVNDLVLPDGSAGGTEVTLKLPVIYD